MALVEPFPSIASGITEAVFGYILENSNIAQGIKEKLGLDPIKLAYKNALTKAISEFQKNNSYWYANLFDSSFLQQEARQELAQFLLPSGQPDSFKLAQIWVDSLGNQNPEKRNNLVLECEPASAEFLHIFSVCLLNQSALREINNERRFEQITEMMQRIVNQFRANKATLNTRLKYLSWLIDRNTYLDPRGTFQVQRQVQLRLDEIYVLLNAQLELAPIQSDIRILEKRLEDFEKKHRTSDLSPEDIENRREEIIARYKPNHDIDIHSEESISLHEAVESQDRLVILGDPGSGKTTFIRYLALHHAIAVRKGMEIGIENPNFFLKKVLFPILIRIADYTENTNWKNKPLSEFLVDACSISECPCEGLNDLFRTELALGSCLILIDGLDEIVEPDDRRDVVLRIEDFVRRYHNGGTRGRNRFVITSRIAGYRSAPLAEPFTHYQVQEMEEYQIRNFLERWCKAVEDAQTSDISDNARSINARREIDGIMSAVKSNPGVRRLASNPLMLRILALIHRTGSQLPQHRIDLYKLATETLSHTWRTAQGVPETALVQEKYLTRLLSKLAYWLHENKSSGIATEHDVYDVLCEEWARINKLDWDENEPNPLIEKEVEKFLVSVREHTGLFVEKAPRRYGFMHLTFEEYYTARYLVSRRRDAAKMIRSHLHNPRWDEPILLALGFVGLDYPDEAVELFETAILAKGREAATLGIKPSENEEFLCRDYLFALRCLADEILMDHDVAEKLIQRLISELIMIFEGSAILPLCFRYYQQTLLERLSNLSGNKDLFDTMTERFLCLIEDNFSISLQDFIPPEVRNVAVIKNLDIFDSDESIHDEENNYELISEFEDEDLENDDDINSEEEYDDFNDDNDPIFNELEYQYLLSQCYPIMEILNVLRSNGEPVESILADALINKDFKSLLKGVIFCCLLQNEYPITKDLLFYIVDNSKTENEIKYVLTEIIYQFNLPSDREDTDNDDFDVLDYGDEDYEEEYFWEEDDSDEEDEEDEYTEPVYQDNYLRSRIPLSTLDLDFEIYDEMANAFIRKIHLEPSDANYQQLIKCLKEKKATPEFCRYLVQLVNSTNKESQRIACGFLFYLDNESKLISESLYSIINNRDSLIRKFAAAGLFKRGLVNNTILNILIGSMKHGPIKSESEDLIRSYEFEDNKLVDVLILRLIDPDNSVRNVCRDAILSFAKHHLEKVESLSQKLLNLLINPPSTDLNLNSVYETLMLTLSL